MTLDVLGELLNRFKGATDISTVQLQTRIKIGCERILWLTEL